MSGVAHTPGPWEAVENGGDDEDTRKLIIVARDRYGEETMIASADDDLAMFDDCDPEANARLIAAAPDLLAALKLAAYELNAIRSRDGAPQHIDWHRGVPLQTDSCTHEWWDELTEKCFAAIARAEGEP